MKLSDVKTDKDTLSLSKLCGGRKIKDIEGQIDEDLVFQIWTIVFEDGSKLWVEGAHDIAYVYTHPNNILPDEETLEELYEEDFDENYS